MGEGETALSGWRKSVQLFPKEVGLPQVSTKEIHEVFHLEQILVMELASLDM